MAIPGEAVGGVHEAPKNENQAWVTEFEQWWDKHGQFCRSGGEYEKTFAFRAWEAATNRATTKRAPKPRELPQVGTGALLGEQQYCFEKGWKEGIAALRKMLRSKAASG